ncbi:bifunctional NAD(P)/FAD-dependent oxidoreductase/class I SAM-dependent methyltransferase [Halobacillus litoralis]|uniref:bifunctional NAD(P)/FAD-dependent oxidoreductase/class I SAM-dependent methyltransferase n=1 Tax=Halobacillus litoralis TaxID=45668 RepID=UPI0032B3AFDD
MILDCAVIGGGPAGLNASLVLGRSRRTTVLFDDDNPRNSVTTESHGFLTRDGMNPAELRGIGRNELTNYPDVKIEKQRVKNVMKEKRMFTIETDTGEVFRAKKVVLASGLKEKLPDINNLKQFYGTSLFSCPFCDGWELKDLPLVVIAGNSRALHMAKLVYNWTSNLVICTNGSFNIPTHEMKTLKEKGMDIYEQKISSLNGENGYLKHITFEDGSSVAREGGFIIPEMEQASHIGENLGCELTDQGAIKTDDFGRTNVEGVYACGDTSLIAPSQLIIAAAEGSKAAIGVNAAMVEEAFKKTDHEKEKDMNKNCKQDHTGNLRKKVEYLDSDERKEQFSPESLLELLPIKNTDDILDVGAGTGFLTIPAAKKTDGMVYALDIDPKILQIANSKASTENLENVRTIQGEMKDLPLADDSIDIVMASLVLHEIKPLSETLQLIHQVIKENGYFACVELEEQPNQNHPRISSIIMEKELNKAGFKVSKKLHPTESIYVLIAQKQNISIE